LELEDTGGFRDIVEFLWEFLKERVADGISLTELICGGREDLEESLIGAEELEEDELADEEGIDAEEIEETFDVEFGEFGSFTFEELLGSSKYSSSARRSSKSCKPLLEDIIRKIIKTCEARSQSCW